MTDTDSKDYSHLLDGLVATLKEEYKVIEDEKILELIQKFNNYMSTFDLRRTREFPFTNEEINYLNSRFLMGMREITVFNNRRHERGHILDLITDLCKLSYIETVQWISENILIDWKYVFRELCGSNYLDMSKWVYNNHSDYIDIQFRGEDERLINNVSTYGYVDMFQWLFQIYNNVPDNVIIQAFRNACNYGHITLAQWIWYKYPNLNYFTRYILQDGECTDPLINAYVNGYDDIVDWLWTLEKKV